MGHRLPAVDALRTAPIIKLDRAMLDAFIAEQHEESVWCDYKRGPGPSIAKCVAAMAKTQGGTVLIGVDESAGKPTTCPGVDGEPHKLTERIESMLYDAIRPTLLAQVKAIDVGAGKCVIVVRVPVSLSAPHALRDGSIYIRVMQHSRPTEEPAQLGWLEFLFDRRREPERFRRQLDEEAAVLLHRATVDAYPGANPPPIMSFRACVPFPTERLFPERQVRELVEPVLEFRPTPYAGGGLLRRQWFNDIGNRTQFSLARAHVAGHVFIAEPIFLMEERTGAGILPAFIRAHVTQAWTRGCAILWLMGYRGVVSTRLEFTQAYGLKFVPIASGVPEPSESIVDAVNSQSNRAPRRGNIAKGRGASGPARSVP
jgi:Putative DNA-binding domain